MCVCACEYNCYHSVFTSEKEGCVRVCMHMHSEYVSVCVCVRAHAHKHNDALQEVSLRKADRAVNISTEN